jgi:hypothetical protein
VIYWVIYDSPIPSLWRKIERGIGWVRYWGIERILGFCWVKSKLLGKHWVVLWVSYWVDARILGHLFGSLLLRSWVLNTSHSSSHFGFCLGGVSGYGGESSYVTRAINEPKLLYCNLKLYHYKTYSLNKHSPEAPIEHTSHEVGYYACECGDVAHSFATEQ